MDSNFFQLLLKTIVHGILLFGFIALIIWCIKSRIKYNRGDDPKDKLDPVKYSDYTSPVPRDEPSCSEYILLFIILFFVLICLVQSFGIYLIQFLQTYVNL